MKLFRIDSPGMIALTKATDFLILNLLFLLFCIPIISVGASITALYTVVFKLEKENECYIFKTFWKAFRDNFKISTIAWVAIVLIWVIVGIDFTIIQQSTFYGKSTLLVFLIILELILLVSFIYLFPYIAKFENSVKDSIINSLVIGIANLPYTVLLVSFFIACTFMLIKLSFFGAILAFFCGFSVVAYTSTWIFTKVFSKYKKR